LRKVWEKLSKHGGDLKKLVFIEGTAKDEELSLGREQTRWRRRIGYRLE